MSGEKPSKSSKLPPRQKSKVVDVSLKHVILGFTLTVTSVTALSVSVILLRDYSRYRRQTAVVESIKELILALHCSGSPQPTNTETEE